MSKCATCGHPAALHILRTGDCVVRTPRCRCKRYMKEEDDGTVAFFGGGRFGHAPTAGQLERVKEKRDA